MDMGNMDAGDGKRARMPMMHCGQCEAAPGARRDARTCEENAPE